MALGIKIHSGSSTYVTELRDDGGVLVFYVPKNEQIREEHSFWENGRSRPRRPDDDPAGLSIKFEVGVIVTGGSKKILSVSKNFIKRWDAATEKVGGTLHSHVFEVTRIGAKGDKNTAYMFRCLGPVPASAAALTPPTPTPPVGMDDAKLDELFGSGGVK